MKTETENVQKTFDFNSILGWFGFFTPQFKNYLIAFQRAHSPETFEQLSSEVFRLFRQFLFDLSKLKKGSKRAEWVHNFIDRELNATGSERISCQSGCGACCHFEKHISDDETDRIVEFATENGIDMNWSLTQSQAERYSRKEKWSSLITNENRCAFLNSKNNCSIYPARPAVCRKHRVTSPRAECEKGPDGIVQTDAQLMPEIITSAAMSLPDNNFGPMPVQLAKRLQ